MKSKVKGFKKDSTIVKILRDITVALGISVLDFLICLPVLFMVLITSAFNDTGYRVESVLQCMDFMLFLMAPLIVVQIILHIFLVKKVVKYTITKCLIGVFSMCIVIYAYGMLSSSYAPDCLFLKISKFMF